MMEPITSLVVLTLASLGFFSIFALMHGWTES